MSDYFPHIPSASEIASAVANAIRDLIGDLLDRPLDTVDNVVDEIADTVNNAIDSASHTIDTAIGVAGKSVDNAITSATGVANRAIDAASSTVNRALDNATTAVNNAVGVAGKAVDNAIAAGQAVANRSIDAAERTANNAVNGALGSVNRTIDNARAAADNAINSGRQIATQAIDVADRRIGQVVQSAKDAIVTVAGDVKTGLENAGRSFERGVGSAVSTVGNYIGGAIDTAEKAVDKAITRAGNFVQSSVNAASDFINRIGSTISTNLGGLMASLNAEWDALMNSITVWWQDTVRYIEELITRVDTFISENFNKAWDWITTEAAAYGQNVQDNLARLENGIESIGTKLFSCGYQSYAGVIGDIAGLGLDSSLVRILVYGVLAAGVVMAGAPTAAHPYLQCIANIGMQEVRPMSADLATLAQAIVRGKTSGGAFGEASGRLGVPDGHAQAYIDTARSSVPVGTTVAGLIRGNIDRPTAEAQLTDASYDPGYLDQFVSASRPLISAAEALTAARRGGWSKDNADAELAKAGYSAEQAAALARLTDQLLTPDQYVTLWLRQEIDEPTLDALLAERGYAERERGIIKSIAYFVPPPSDLITMSLKDVWNQEIVDTFGLEEDYPEEFEKYAGFQGISPFWAKKYWATAWSYPSNTQGFEMFQRGFITQKELELLLKTNDVPPFWRDRLIKINYNPITRVDIRRMYQMGVLTADQVTKSYLNIGYSPEDAAALTEFTKRYVAEAEASNQSKVKELSRAQIEQAYTSGVFTQSEALDALLHLNYRKEDAELLLQLAVVRTATDASDTRYKAHIERTIKIVIAAFSAHIISQSAATDMLTDMGMTPNEITREFALVSWEQDVALKDSIIDRVRELSIEHTMSDGQRDQLLGAFGLLQPEIAALTQEWDILKTFRKGKPTRADVRRWYKNGLIDSETYADELRGLGYAEQYVQLFVFEDTA